jgi:hypothetical protein
MTANIQLAVIFSFIKKTHEPGLLRAAALNLGFGAVPQAIPLWLAVGQPEGNCKY